ncbi:ribonuclease P protein subunit p21 [Syngnathoides biaculeatus]|uniref:ribonuclease P protein subunit p21 n=1 Tax=Syngnathoides biaculeatus TaxID=300417 RepID=UPI002ADE395A|nr:ribonuclease P protein subunit p21 [Syngnathoides biaculeatus]
MSGQVKDKEAYQRLNYLYQAAHCVLSQNPENVELARFYCFTQRTIAKRLVLRQDPSVKRTICKKCCSLLIPGVTTTTRQQRKRGKKSCFTVQRCLCCKRSKKLLNDPDYCLWQDRPEAQAQPQQKQPDEDSSRKQNQPKKTKPDRSDCSKAGTSSATAEQKPA